jgi:hypothetical protein
MTQSGLGDPLREVRPFLSPRDSRRIHTSNRPNPIDLVKHAAPRMLSYVLTFQEIMRKAELDITAITQLVHQASTITSQEFHGATDFFSLSAVGFPALGPSNDPPHKRPLLSVRRFVVSLW